jgi:hypothetical protein
MQHNPTPRSFWEHCAAAQLLALEGNRLIGREIAAGIRGLWRRVMHWPDVGQQRHSPPI